MHKCSFGWYFWKPTKKVIDCQKRHFVCFWLLITFFSVFSKILIKICASIVFKAKTKEKNEEHFLQFLFQNSKTPFLGVNTFFLNFFSVLAFKTIDTQTFFWLVQYFWKSTKKTLLTAKNSQNGIFEGQ